MIVVGVGLVAVTIGVIAQSIEPLFPEVKYPPPFVKFENGELVEI